MRRALVRAALTGRARLPSPGTRVIGWRPVYGIIPRRDVQLRQCRPVPRHLRQGVVQVRKGTFPPARGCSSGHAAQAGATSAKVFPTRRAARRAIRCRTGALQRSRESAVDHQKRFPLCDCGSREPPRCIGNQGLLLIHANRDTQSAERRLLRWCYSDKGDGVFSREGLRVQTGVVAAYSGAPLRRRIRRRSYRRALDRRRAHRRSAKHPQGRMCADR